MTPIILVQCILITDVYMLRFSGTEKVNLSARTLNHDLPLMRGESFWVTDHMTQRESVLIGLIWSPRRYVGEVAVLFLPYNGLIT